MGRAVVRVGPGRSVPVKARRAAVRRQLTASGVLPTFDLGVANEPARLRFLDETRAAQFVDLDGGWWPCEADGLADDGAIFRDGQAVVYRLSDGTLAYATLGWGGLHVQTAGASRQACAVAIAAFRAAYPATYITASDDHRIPVTFWALGPMGPVQRMRLIDASPWADISRNYTADVRDRLDALMTGFKPGAGGQFLLWQGEPGTGKTWALRALVSEWGPWAEAHYITDPDAFFVDSAVYMVDVLLADTYDAIDEPTGDLIAEEAADGKWRLLILEDTGELLSAKAKEKYGQGLSRLLNVVDGMIGQGLRVLVLVTTNDELGELNPAVMRPGRCASQIEFAPLTRDEVRAWAVDLGLDPDDVDEADTIAQLYARAGSGAEPIPERPDYPDDPEPDDDARDLMAAADQHAAALETRERIAEVAAEHQPAEAAYGQVAYNSETGAVLWVSWDGTSVEDQAAAEAAFLAIPGVKSFDATAEGLPSGWWDDGSEVVYPDDPPLWVTRPADEEAALAETLALAAEPLEPAVPAPHRAAAAPPTPRRNRQDVLLRDAAQAGAYGALAAMGVAVDRGSLDTKGTS